MNIDNLTNEIDRLKSELENKKKALEDAQRASNNARQQQLVGIAGDLAALVADSELAVPPANRDSRLGDWVEEAPIEVPDYNAKTLPRREGVHLYGIYNRKGYECTCPVLENGYYTLENVVLTVVLDGQRPEVQQLLREHTSGY